MRALAPSPGGFARIAGLLARSVTGSAPASVSAVVLVYEELWHGEAVSGFLRAYGLESPPSQAARRLDTDADASAPRLQPPRAARRGHQLHLLPTMIASMATRHFIGIHMTLGAINELTTLQSYHALIRRAPDHPVLHQLLRRLLRDERRH